MQPSLQHAIKSNSLLFVITRMDGWMVRVNGILSTQVAAISCLKKF